MKKILLMMVITILALAVVASAKAVVKPTPIDITVYYSQGINALTCPYGLNNNYTCADSSYTYCCAKLLGICIGDCGGYFPYQLVNRTIAEEDNPIASANIGETYFVKGTIFSEVPKDATYKYVVKLGTQVLYKTAKATIPSLDWDHQFSLPDFTFETWGMHSFILQVFNPNGTISTVTKNVFVPAPPAAEPALEEEPVFEELAASAVVKPTPIDISVFYNEYINVWLCPYGLQDGRCGYTQSFCCEDSIFGCISNCSRWVSYGFGYYNIGQAERPIASANIGETYFVKGTIFSEVPKDTTYKYVVKLGTEVLYKTDKATIPSLDWERQVSLPDFTFERSGMHSFILKVFRPNGTILSVTKKVFVPAVTVAGPALEEELVLEEGPVYEEESVLAESIEE